MYALHVEVGVEWSGVVWSGVKWGSYSLIVCDIHCNCDHLRNYQCVLAHRAKFRSSAHQNQKCKNSTVRPEKVDGETGSFWKIASTSIYQ